MGRKRNKNKNRSQPFVLPEVTPASTISESEKGNTICCSYVPDRAIDTFKTRNENLRHRAEKKGNNFEAMIFDMMNNAIEEARTDRLVKHLSINK